MLSRTYFREKCETQIFCVLRLKGIRMDSVFDGESEYIKCKKFKRTEGDKIFCFLSAPNILRISPPKLDRIRIKR